MVLIKVDNAVFYTSHHFPASHEGNPSSILVMLKEKLNVKYKRKGFLSPNESSRLFFFFLLEKHSVMKVGVLMVDSLYSPPLMVNTSLNVTPI